MYKNKGTEAFAVTATNRFAPVEFAPMNIQSATDPAVEPVGVAGRVPELGLPGAGVVVHPLTTALAAIDPETELVSPIPTAATNLQGPPLSFWTALAPETATWS